MRTPQEPGSTPGGYGTLSTELLTDYHYNSIIKVERTLVCLECWERIPRSCLAQGIKIGSCVFKCDGTHQWRERQVDPVTVYKDGVGVILDSV